MDPYEQVPQVRYDIKSWRPSRKVWSHWNAGGTILFAAFCTRMMQESTSHWTVYAAFDAEIMAFVKWQSGNLPDYTWVFDLNSLSFGLNNPPQHSDWWYYPLRVSRFAWFGYVWMEKAPLLQQLHPYSNGHFHDAVPKKIQEPVKPCLLHWVSLDLNFPLQLFWSSFRKNWICGEGSNGQGLILPVFDRRFGSLRVIAIFRKTTPHIYSGQATYFNQLKLNTKCSDLKKWVPQTWSFFFRTEGVEEIPLDYLERWWTGILTFLQRVLWYSFPSRGSILFDITAQSWLITCRFFYLSKFQSP